jgi:HptB-dependent secretion and biofilm anti anti-sigma factor
MALCVHISPDRAVIDISVNGRFELMDQQDFQPAFEGIEGVTRYIIDLREARRLDCAGLGMLLMLRNHAGGRDADIRIVNAAGEVRDTLALAHFERLFRIE